jgi:hypothetical protein
MSDQMTYGLFSVEEREKRGSLGNVTPYAVTHGSGDDGDEVLVDTSNSRQDARTLAAALSAAGMTTVVDAVPPNLGGRRGEGGWESWGAETNAVPARVAGAGAAPTAAYIKVVHRERESWIANRLGVSESTVRQYLSDLRAGRR